LKQMALHAIDGIPQNCQILHVEQEVVGDDTSVLQCVLSSDVERTQLLAEEAQLAQQRDDSVTISNSGLPMTRSHGSFLGVQNGRENPEILMENGKTKEGEVTGEAKQPRSDRLVQIYKRLEQIDAYSAESRAASILAVSSLYLP
jgi:ATP-binding cassette subfamily F protein 3